MDSPIRHLFGSCITNDDVQHLSDGYIVSALHRASTVHRERYDEGADRSDAAQVGVIANKLASAVLAQVALFSLPGFAILDDVQR